MAALVMGLSAVVSLAAGPPAVVAITPRVEDGPLVVRMDDGRGTETLLGKYERAPERSS